MKNIRQNRCCLNKFQTKEKRNLCRRELIDLHPPKIFLREEVPFLLIKHDIFANISYILSIKVTKQSNFTIPIISYRTLL